MDEETAKGRGVRTKILTVLAAAGIWITGAYPPWKLTFAGRDHNGVISTAIANDWLLTEKALPDRKMLDSVTAGIGYSVDFGRLAVEWAVIAALYAAAVVVLRVRPSSAHSEAQ